MFPFRFGRVRLLVLLCVTGLLAPNTRSQAGLLQADVGNSTPATAETGKQESTASPQTRSDFVPFHNIGVRLKKPKGFRLSESFDGFHNDEGTSVLATRLDGPYLKASAGFRDKAQMRKNRMKLISQKNVKIDGLAGIQMEIEQSVSGLVFRKFVVCIGDDKQTRLIMATYPKDDADRFARLLKDVVETVQVIAVDESKSNIGFTVNSGSLKRSKGVGGKMLAYTKDGKFPQKDPGDPLLILSPSLGNVQAVSWPNDGVKKKYARQRLDQIANTRITRVISVAPVTIDGQSGFETIADALREDKKISLRVYQVMLFGNRDYFLVQGMVAKEQADKYTSEFRKITRSLKRTTYDSKKQ